MKCSIGDMLRILRERAGISQHELAEGILSIARVSRIENGEREEDKFVLAALFQRVGESVDKFEAFTSAEEYQMVLRRNLIIRSLTEKNLPVAAVLLQEYRERTENKNHIHEQYFWQMRAVNYYLADRDGKTCIKNLSDALEITVPASKWEQKNWENIRLCTQELYILLMLGCVWIEEGETDRALDVLEKLWKYIDRNMTDEQEREKLYPKCAWLLGEVYVRMGWIERAYKICELGKECLAESGALIVMDKLLVLEEICLKKLGRENERKTLKKQLEAVEDLYKMAEFKLPEEKILRLLLTSERNEILISNEVIRELRRFCGLSQEELCDEVCSRETLSRIEGGQRSPNREKLQGLLKKMGEEREKYYGYVITNDSDVYRKVNLYKKSWYRKERDKASILLNEIEAELDMSNLINRQFIESNRLTEQVEKGEMDYETAISELERILKYTMDKSKGDIYRIPYREEFIILNCMAIYNRSKGNEKEAERIYEQLLRQYRESKTEEIHHSVPLSLLYINYTGLLEVMDELERAEEIGKRGLWLMAESQRGDLVAKLLGNLSCVYDKKNTRKDEEICERCMRYSYWLQILYHLEKDSLVIKDAYEKKYAKRID